MAQIHSTGRGGAGNIGPDEQEYTDGGIVREGPEGVKAGPGEYSTGRGGAGNISDDPKGQPAQRLDDEIVPETATREDRTGDYANYHTGRGGLGNVHKDKFGGHSSQKEQDEAEKRAQQQVEGKEGFGDKVKKALHMDKK